MIAKGQSKRRLERNLKTFYRIHLSFKIIQKINYRRKRAIDGGFPYMRRKYLISKPISSNEKR